MPKVSFTKDERANLLLRQVQAREEYSRVVDDEYARNPNHPDENRISAALALVTQPAGPLALFTDYARIRLHAHTVDMFMSPPGGKN